MINHSKRLDEVQIKILKQDVNDDELINGLLAIMAKSEINYERKEKALHLVNEMLFDKIVSNESELKAVTKINNSFATKINITSLKKD